MVEFPDVPLGQVLQRVKDDIEIEDDVTYKQVTVRLWNKGVILRGQQQGSEIKTKRQYRVRAGQLILSRIDVRNGAIGLVPPELDGAVISNDFWAYDIDHSIVDPNFLALCVTTPSFIEDSDRTSSGTTKRIRAEEGAFLRIEIPLPPLAEQQRILARVEALARRVEEAWGLRIATEEAVNGFVASLHLQLSGTRELAVGDFLVLDEKREPVEAGEQYPQVGVKGFGKGLFARETLDATETTYKAFNRLFNGATVLSQVKGWEGAIGVCDHKLAGRYVSPEYRTFSCIPGMATPCYLSALFATPWYWTKLKDLTRGVGARRERIRPEYFLKMRLPMPGLGDQFRAVDIFKKLEVVRRLQAATQKEMDAMMPSILAKAFAGEL